MILLIDNYDSFSYNLYQLLGTMEEEIKVVRNDEITISEIRKYHPKALILSPGPGRPKNAGICVEAVQTFAESIPILGVCLGHQAVCEAFGGRIIHAKELKHGKQDRIYIEQENQLLQGLAHPFLVARYHSLAVEENSLPKELEVIARAQDEEIMAVAHRKYPIYGLQFHPESVMTPDGSKILKNFMEVVK